MSVETLVYAKMFFRADIDGGGVFKEFITTEVFELSAWLRK